MSASLGRPVHLDRVSVHVLPVPGFTLENLVVSEDPAFGDEPTIRANTVEARLRPSSLWRRQVEFSTIRFIEPSVNIVRNPQGLWNLQTLLMHAATVETAPTAQPKAGPTPRFPYIEATGARVNLKLGNEKQPFSLTDADFALWLPSPETWRVRIEARPSRTDQNTADPGTVRLEGSLERAPTMAEVPVDLHATWTSAPLGEASRLLSGADAGWRGALTLDTALSGKLGDAKLATTLHLEDLRRADFIPAKSLTLDVDCTTRLIVTTAILHDPACTLRSPRIDAIADILDLSTLDTTGARIGASHLPQAWLLDWARLFSTRIPPTESPSGTLTGSFAYLPRPKSPPKSAATHTRKSPITPTGWQGEAHGDLAPVPTPAPTSTPNPNRPAFTITAGPNGLVLAPLNLTPAEPSPLVLTGVAAPQGYALHLTGSASLPQLRALAATAPPLADGLFSTLPAPSDDDSNPSLPLKLDVTCIRTWSTPQTCTTTPPPTKPTHPHRHP